MKLALIGCDSESLALVRALIDSSADAEPASRIQFVAAFDAEKWEQELIQLAGAIETRGDWESILLAAPVDAVLVARGQLDPAEKTGFSGQERRCEQLRKIVQAGLPLIVVQPGCEEIVGFELEMIRSDQNGILVPWLPGFVPEAVTAFCRLAHTEDSPLGIVEQVTAERELADRSRSNVLLQFSRDAEILRRLLLNITKVTASGPVSESMRDPMAGGPRPLLPLSNLSVHLSGKQPFPARWSVIPSESPAGARFTLQGTQGKAVLHVPQDPLAAWRLEINSQVQVLAPVPAAQQLRSAIEQANSPEHAGDWLGACRSIEATSCIDRSLQRGRAIELFNEEHSEEGTFKGLMAAGGCLMLMATLGIIVFLAGLEGVFGSGALNRAWWPVLLVTPMVVFMLLQLLLGLTRRASSNRAR